MNLDDQYKAFKKQAYDIKKLKRKIRYCHQILESSSINFADPNSKFMKNFELGQILIEKLTDLTDHGYIKDKSPEYDYLLRQFKQFQNYNSNTTKEINLDEGVEKNTSKLLINNLGDEKFKGVFFLPQVDTTNISKRNSDLDYPSKEEIKQILFQK